VTPTGRSRRRRRSRFGPVVVLIGLIGIVGGLGFWVGALAPTWTGGSQATANASPAAADSALVANPSTASRAPDRPDQINRAPSDLDHPTTNGVAFNIDVPAIGYSATVREGVDAGVLGVGPGHYPGSAWPGQAGTVGVAAHNVYWLSFNRLHVGDTVEIRTQHGQYIYVITGIKVTDPSDRTVIVPTVSNRIALTTCYPLWAGAFATQRLVFLGVQTGAVAE